MKILQVIPYFVPAWDYGGPLRNCYESAKQLVRRGHEVTVYTTDAFNAMDRIKQREEIIDGTLQLGVIPEAIGDAFNLASETETKVIDIANMVNEITGNPNGVEFVPRRDWDKITRRRASIEKARKVLGYEPKTKMKEGIKKTYDWIVENRDRIEASARF